MSNNDENILKQLFYSPKEGFVNLQKLYNIAKNLGFTYDEVKDFYYSQPVVQIMKPLRKPKEFNSIIANYPGDIFQLDIIVYDRYVYHNYKYMLVCIDIYSRYLSVRPMTNRRIETITNAFEDIITHKIKVNKKMVYDMGVPRLLESDNEFNKKTFLDLLDKYDIQYRFSDPNEIHKNAIVERCNGTIANLIQKIRISTGRYDWYNYLNDVVYNYNHSLHSTIKEEPFEVMHMDKFNHQIYKIIPNPYQIGDKVRILTEKTIFDKGDIIKASKEIYVVEDIKGNRIKLLGVQKLYKPYELSRVYSLDEDNNIFMPKQKQNQIN